MKGQLSFWDRQHQAWEQDISEHLLHPKCSGHGDSSRKDSAGPCRQGPLTRPLYCARLAAPEQADGGHQRCQGGDHKEQDEDNPVVVQHAFVGRGLLRWDHVGEVQHVA